MSDYALRPSRQREVSRCRTEGRCLLSASLVLAAAVGTASFAVPVLAAGPTSFSFLPSGWNPFGLPAIASAVVRPSMAALMAHDDAGDAWLPEIPEPSLVPPSVTDAASGAVPLQDADYATTTNAELRARCSPNPFVTSTSVVFNLPQTARVALTVHDASGREVRRLADGDAYGAGSHFVPWDGRDDFGREVASGTYFVRLRLER